VKTNDFTDFLFKHLVVDLIRVFIAFTGNMDLPGSPEKYYANVNTALTMTKNASFISESLLVDILLVKLPILYAALRSYHVITGVSNVRCLGPQILGRYSPCSSTRFGCR